MNIPLEGSVGIGGQNNNADVKAVQTALNNILHLIPPTQKLAVDGSLGSNPENSKTVEAIKIFQKKVVFSLKPDGRIDVNGKTHKKLNEKNIVQPVDNASTLLPATKGKPDLTIAAFTKAANAIGCEVAAIQAVADVESAGDGFFASGKPKILFEAHIFSRETKGAYDTSHPKVSSKRRNKSLYTVGEKEYDRLKEAMALDRSAAIRSTSWGKFQIMGFNHEAAGYNALETFLSDMFISESKQLDAFTAFLKSEKLDVPLKAKNWAKFAEGYNGSAYKENKYDTKLQTAYEKYAKVK